MAFKNRYITEDETSHSSVSKPGGVKTITREPTGIKADNDNTGGDSTDNATDMAAANTFIDKAADRSLPNNATVNDIDTKIRSASRIVEEAVIDRRFLEEATKKEQQADNRYKKAIGLPSSSFFKAIVPNKDVEELAGEALEPNKKAKAQVRNTTSTTMKSVTTHLSKDPLNSALTGLGTNQKKQGQKKKDAKSSRTPGNLDLPGNMEEASLLLEYVSRSSAGDTKTLGGPDTGVKGQKPTVGRIVDDIGDRISRHNNALNSSRDDAGDVRIKGGHTSIYSLMNTKSRQMSAENNRKTQERLAAEEEEKRAKEAEKGQGNG